MQFRWIDWNLDKIDAPDKSPLSDYSFSKPQCF